MTPEEFARLGAKVYGAEHWRQKFADALGVNASTIHRVGKKTRIPNVYEVAMVSFWNIERQRREIAKQQRALNRMVRK